MSKPNPPRLANWLFDRYCGNAGVDDLRGDMEEVFHRNVKDVGRRKAKSIYWRQVLSLVFSYAIRKRKKNSSYSHLSSSSNPFDMWSNYLKVGLRNLMRHRYFTILNMVGLAIGMSVSLLILTLFVSVTNYDEFHVNKNNIYRVLTFTNAGDEFASAPAVLGEKLKAEFPGIKEVIQIDRSLYISEPLPKHPVFTGGYYVDPSFLSSFTFPLLKGDSKTALNDPHSIVITQTQATKIFGEVEAMGKFISVNNQQYEVTGIMKDFPPATHFSFNAISPYSAISEHQLNVPVKDAWSEFRDHFVYFRLSEGEDPSQVQAYLDKVADEVYKSNPDFKATFHVQALGDITPGPEYENDIGPAWTYISFVIAGSIALLILLPACFNYTNISIARSLKRAKEIGLRKTLGGMQRQIFSQFIAETVIVTICSLIGGIALFFLARGEFQAMMAYGNSLDLSLTWDRLLYFIAFAVFTGFIAGFFPALHFSRLNPIEAMKNNVPTKKFSGIKVRKALIVFQFTLCLFFILTLVIFSKQYRYAMNFDLGFGEENILDVDLYESNPEVVQNEFSKLPFVQNVSFSSGVMGHGVPGTWTSLEGSKDSTEVNYMFVDGNFISNMDVKLLAGNTFDNDYKNGETSVIINETLMKRFNFAGPSEALGQMVHVDTLSLKIIGVIKDFHYWQLHAPPGKFFFRYKPSEFRLANVKMASADVQASLEEMEQTWRKFSNGELFTAKFLSDETAAAFYQYRTLLKLMGSLGLLAVSISCLGLLGMVVYTAESKTKEVGIRKVMGASRWSLAYLLSREFLVLMAIASLFALPVTLLLDMVLSKMDYYRVAITFLDVFFGLAIMFLLGIVTMASQTWKTASTNPADTLKYE